MEFLSYIERLPSKSLKPLVQGQLAGLNLSVPPAQQSWRDPLPTPVGDAASFGYPLDASCDAIVQATVSVLARKDGFADFTDEQLLMEVAERNQSDKKMVDKIHCGCSIDASQLDNDDGLYSVEPTARLVTELYRHCHKVYALRCEGALLDSDKVDKLVLAVTDSRRFCHLAELCLCYLPLSLQAISGVTRTLNPVVSGYCPIKRLVLTRCSLEPSGCCRVLGALRGNVFIEEVVLTGNRGGDAMAGAYADICGHDLSKIRSLGLGDNGLSAAAIALLAPTLRADPYLRDLDLHGNPLGDEAVEQLFSCIRDNNVLSSLNLADTGIERCDWADQLRVITNIGSLCLANNRIGDEGLVRLSEGLEKAFCLRRLDLSNNLFTGRKCVCLGRMLQANRGLLFLSLSSNRLRPEVWEALAEGLKVNRTLLNLKLTHCGLDPPSADLLCSCYESNDVCNIDLAYNDLPAAARADSRQLQAPAPSRVAPAGKRLTRRDRNRLKRIIAQVETLADSKAAVMAANQLAAVDAAAVASVPRPQWLPLSTTASGASLYRSYDWRRERLHEIQSAKDSLKMLHRLGLVGSEFEQAVGDGRSIGSVVRGRLLADISSDSVEGADDSASAAGSLGSSVNTVRNIDASARMAKANRLIRAQAERDTEVFSLGRKQLSVCYAYANNGVGAIEVTDSTTYRQAHDMIRPLLEEYFASNDIARAYALIENFKILDHEGAPVEGVAAKLRTIWADAVLNGQNVLLRPGDWVCLGPKEHGDDEDEDEDLGTGAYDD